jgi:hypothetical protein
MASKLINVDHDYNSIGRILNLPDPTLAQHPATKAYVDAAIEGLAWKDSVRAASTANVTISNPGTAVFDGVTLTANDRFLLKDQTAPAENGIYIFNGSGVALTRTLDANSAVELEAAVVGVEEGTANAGTQWRQTSVNFALGSGAVAWTAFATSVASSSETVQGKIEIATQAETDTGTDDVRAITPLKFKTASFLLKRYAATIGDNSSTSIAVTHNLGSTDVIVQVFEIGGSKRQVDCEVRITDSNTVTLLFASAPATNAYRVIVLY